MLVGSVFSAKQQQLGSQAVDSGGVPCAFHAGFPCWARWWAISRIGFSHHRCAACSQTLRLSRYGPATSFLGREDGRSLISDGLGCSWSCLPCVSCCKVFLDGHCGNLPDRLGQHILLSETDPVPVSKIDPAPAAIEMLYCNFHNFQYPSSRFLSMPAKLFLRSSEVIEINVATLR